METPRHGRVKWPGHWQQLSRQQVWARPDLLPFLPPSPLRRPALVLKALTRPPVPPSVVWAPGSAAVCLQTRLPGQDAAGIHEGREAAPKGPERGTCHSPWTQPAEPTPTGLGACTHADTPRVGGRGGNQLAPTCSCLHHKSLTLPVGHVANRLFPERPGKTPPQASALAQGPRSGAQVSSGGCDDRKFRPRLRATESDGFTSPLASPASLPRMFLSQASQPTSLPAPKPFLNATVPGPLLTQPGGPGDTGCPRASKQPTANTGNERLRSLHMLEQASQKPEACPPPAGPEGILKPWLRLLLNVRVPAGPAPALPGVP